MNAKAYYELLERIDALEKAQAEAERRVATLERMLAGATRAKGAKEAA